MSDEAKSKYSGYGYHGGGRKNYGLSLQQEEIDLIKEKAKTKGLPASRYIMSLVNADSN